jgi:integrase
MAYASVRKRTWQTKGGPKTAFIADYFAPDKAGKMVRHIKTFSRQKDARDWLDDTKPKIKTGQHVPESKAPTVRAAADKWIEQGEVDGLESSTMRQRRLHVDHHIVALLGGDTKLVRVDLAAFRNDLLRSCSKPMAKKVMTSFKSILKQAKLAHLAGNIDPIEKKGQAKRRKRKLKVGVDIPRPAEIKAVIEATADDPKARALVCLAAFAGLRASEIRGLGWSHLDLGSNSSPKVTIEERADETGAIGEPKSEASHRTIALGEATVDALREWKLAQPPVVAKDESGAKIRRPRTLVFGTGNDRPDGLPNVRRRVLEPAMLRAGVALPVLDDAGKPVVDKKGRTILRAKYTGLHCLRHYAVSSWLKTCNGDFKAVQERAGHATLALTIDTYGHLLSKDGEGDQIAAAEKLALG